MSTREILIISSEFPPGPGGIGRHAYDLSLALANNDYRVEVLTPMDYTDDESKAAFKKSLPNLIEIIELPRKGVLTFFRRIKKILNSITQYQPEHVILSGKFPVWMANLIKRVSSKPFQLHAFVHGSEVLLPVWWQRRLFAVGLKVCDHIYPVSNFTRGLLEQLNIGSKDIKVIQNGIHIEEWKRYQSFPALEWKGTPKLLTVGNVAYRKGQQRVIKALGYLRNMYHDIAYHVVGLPTKQHEFQQLAQSLEIDQHVNWHGKLTEREELARAYQTADVFIMLSENQPDGDVEGFGIAILEANFFGLPAIGAKECGIEDAIQDGLNGRLVDGDDAEEILEALQDILSHYNDYSENARAWVKQHDWNSIVQKLDL